MKTKKQQIDYYGCNDNYIHLKFGDVRKNYNFTADFIEKYPDFSSEFSKYFSGSNSKYQNPFQIVHYVYENKLPIHFYYNFTGTPAKNEKEIMDYLVREQSYISKY